MGTRPPHVKAPDYLSKSPPVPEPKAVDREPEPDSERLDPVRYGANKNPRPFPKGRGFNVEPPGQKSGADIGKALFLQLDQPHDP